MVEQVKLDKIVELVHTGGVSKTIFCHTKKEDLLIQLEELYNHYKILCKQYAQKEELSDVDKNTITDFFVSKGDSSVCGSKKFKSAISVLKDLYYGMINKINNGDVKIVNQPVQPDKEMPKEEAKKNSHDICNETERVKELGEFIDIIKTKNSKNIEINLPKARANIDEIDFHFRLTCQKETTLEICNQKNLFENLKLFIYNLQINQGIEVSEGSIASIVTTYQTLNTAISTLCGDSAAVREEL